LLCLNRETEVACDVADLGCGAGRIGRGGQQWAKFAREIVGADCRCIDCEGTVRATKTSRVVPTLEIEIKARA
jgi:16S rRNA G1207 methylase RsmC